MTQDPAPDGGASGADFWLKQQLGFTLETGAHGAVARLTCDERHLNPHGTVHGAVLFALVDTAMGAATMEVVPPGSLCATIEIHTRFLTPVFGGELSAEVTVIKAGRRVVQLDATVTGAGGEAVARASGSFAVFPAPSGPTSGVVPPGRTA